MKWACSLLIFLGMFSAGNYSMRAASYVDPAPNLPRRVLQAIDAYAEECKQIGGKLNGVRAPKMLIADLDGDRQPDYVLDPENLHCSSSATLFCPGSGCEIKILASFNDYTKIIDMPGASPLLVQRAGGTNVEVTVQNYHCAAIRAPNTCIAVISWEGGRRTVNYVSRKPH